jgi:hypothetical protein
VRRLLEVLQEPGKVGFNPNPMMKREVHSLVPIILSNIVRDERMLVSRSGDRGDQGETVLQLV